MFYIFFCSFTLLAGKWIFCQGAGAGCFWPLGAGAAKKKYQEPEPEPLGKTIRSRSRSRLKISQEPEPLKNLPAPQPCFLCIDYYSYLEPVEGPFPFSNRRRARGTACELCACASSAQFPMARPLFSGFIPWTWFLKEKINCLKRGGAL